MFLDSFGRFLKNQLSYSQTGAIRVGSNNGEAVAWFVQAAHSKGDDGGVVPGNKVLWSKKIIALNNNRTNYSFLHLLHILLQKETYSSEK